ncbi:recombinase XerD [Mycobacterium sp. 21AC1]|uniref:recombinase XerD n=1 Tax=[Mycobacterium] appelbergii TaxID=2939269 RepID=UPI0029393408|nr:recombinase XerD [Mycobacterium sp. 21AC1]MDV3129108.1 recombinase XerD [Mycobacterium sp. 21AC1]
MTIEPQRRNTVRGRPKVTDGSMECARCHREMRRTAATWPDGRICNSCYYEATSFYGDCPSCGFHRLLPGRLDIGDQAVCRDCARIRQNFYCTSCNEERRPYRGNVCARCTLREDLERTFVHSNSPAGFSQLIDALCAADRAESIITWKRSDKVQGLLRSLGDGTTPLTHDGLDQYEPSGRHVDHLRAILQHHEVLPPRDKYLAYFERWIEEKLCPVSDPEIATPIKQFATWHHLKRINELALAGKPTRGPVHASKQDITEALKFLVWLRTDHGRTIAGCTQQDVDLWVAAGPTTRHLIRTFIIWCKKMRVNRSITLGHRQAKTVRVLTQDQRLEWIRELLSGDNETLPYRVAGTLLLLYAQPLVKVSAIPMSKVLVAPDGLSIELGVTASPVPEPFAELLKRHIGSRPNLRTAGADNLWLFPGYRPGEHLHPNTLMDRLRWLGIGILGARNTALRELVTQVPPPAVAEMLGYSDQVVHRHAAFTAQAWHRYVPAATAAVQQKRDR